VDFYEIRELTRANAISGNSQYPLQLDFIHFVDKNEEAE
jgi:hypothetical protein